MGLEDSVERIRAALIKKMSGKAYLRPGGLVEGLATDTGESPLTIRQSLGRLSKERWIEGVSPDGAPFAQVRIIGSLPVVPQDTDRQRWISVLERSELQLQDRESLAPLSAKLAAFSESDMWLILQGLISLRESQASETGRHRFLVSARYLLGSSKLLDEFASPSLRAFGIHVDQFQGHPLYVVVAGCQSPDAVVLVENPAAFEMAVATNAIHQCAFVCTYGFGLSKSQEDYGNQLAGMVEDRFASAITLRRDGATCPGAKELLAHDRIAFWGDLDPAGIQIYLRLKKTVPGLRLSALYQPMIASLRNQSRNHPYVSVVGKTGQNQMPITCGEDEKIARELLVLCASRGVDQERVLPIEIELLAPDLLILK